MFKLCLVLSKLEDGGSNKFCLNKCYIHTYQRFSFTPIDPNKISEETFPSFPSQAVGKFALNFKLT